MKTLICLCLALAILLGGCAAGSVGAVGSFVSVRALIADDLSPEAQEKISDEIKDDLKLWIKAEMHEK